MTKATTTRSFSGLEVFAEARVTLFPFANLNHRWEARNGLNNLWKAHPLSHEHDDAFHALISVEHFAIEIILGRLCVLLRLENRVPVARGYRDKQKGFAQIAEVQCNGCGQCACVCKFDAITRKEAK